jgi:predicted metalloprotease with PDZ domain
VRVRADQLPARLDFYKAEDKISLLVARREVLQRLDVRLGTEPPRQWQLEVDPDATDAPVRQRDRWLTGESNG